MEKVPTLPVQSKKNIELDLRPLRLCLMISAFVLSALGCSTMGSIEPLDVTLSNLNFTEVTVFETTLVAKLRITNPNPEPFAIEGGSFKLYLEDKKVGTGTTSESFTVERLDSYVVDVTFHINNASALLRIKDIIETKDNELSYGVRGGLFTEGAFGTKKLKIDKAGTIELGKVKLPGSDEPDIDDLKPPVGDVSS
jgi:LEA14-like dessication related protein